MEQLAPFSDVPALLCYEHPVDGGILECAAIVLLKREHGFLLALPPQELIAAQDGSMVDELGPSLVVTVPGVRLVGPSVHQVPGSQVSALIVDMGAPAAPRLSALAEGAEPELLVPFGAGAVSC